MQVNENGVLSFRRNFTVSSTTPFPRAGDILIAPFWEDVDITISGDIFYEAFTLSPSNVSSIDFIRILFVTPTFNPTSLFVATWDDVAQLGGSTLFVRGQATKIMIATTLNSVPPQST